MPPRPTPPGRPVRGTPTRGEAVAAGSGGIGGRDGASRSPFGAGGASRRSPRPPGRGGGVAVKTRGAVTHCPAEGVRSPAGVTLLAGVATLGPSPRSIFRTVHTTGLAPIGRSLSVPGARPSATRSGRQPVNVMAPARTAREAERHEETTLVRGTSETGVVSPPPRAGALADSHVRTPGICTDESPRDAGSRRLVALTSPAGTGRMAP